MAEGGKNIVERGVDLFNEGGDALKGLFESLSSKDPKISRNDNPSDRGYFYGDSKLASEAFDLDKTSLTGTNPRFAWQYFVQIKINPDIGGAQQQVFNPETGETEPADAFAHSTYSKLLSELLAANVGLAPLIKSVDMPGATMNITTSNAYNRRRLSQSKINFEPITLIMHDVVDGVTLAFWEFYYKYYFLDGNNDVDVDDDIIPQEYKNKFNYGLAMNGADSNGKYLIEYIDIFQIHAGGGKRIRIVHPMISKFEQTTHAYESSEISELSFTLEYEYIYYDANIGRTNDERIGPSSSDHLWGDVRAYFAAQRFIDIRIPGYDKSQAYNKTTGDVPQNFEVATAAGEQGLLDKLGNVSDAFGNIRDVARNVAGEVAKVSAVNNQFNKLQEELFGKTLVDLPTPDVRSFTAKISKVGRQYEVINRITNQAKGVYLGTRNESDPLGTTERDTGNG